MDATTLSTISNPLNATDAAVQELDSSYRVVFEFGGLLEGFFAAPQRVDGTMHYSNMEIYKNEDGFDWQEKKCMTSRDRKMLATLFNHEDFAETIDSLCEYPTDDSCIIKSLYLFCGNAGFDEVVIEIESDEVGVFV